MKFTVDGNTAVVTDGVKTRAVCISGNTVRITDGSFYDDPLVKLDFTPQPVCMRGDGIAIGDHTLRVDDSLRISVTDRSGKIIYSDYCGDATIYERKKDFSLSALEGHKVDETIRVFKTQINIKLNACDRVYGLGDKAAAIDRRGYEYEQWNTDDPSQHNESYKSLYKSINYLLIGGCNGYYGVFYPDTYRTIFNLGEYKPDLLYIGSQKGRFDYYLIFGSSPQDITRQYARLVGRPLLPRLKMLGYQQSRWSYASRSTVESLVDRFKENDVPLDYVHLDIDYMDGYRVYTVDGSRFPDMKGLAQKLGAVGVELVTILDPAVKYDVDYSVYNELADSNGFATQNGNIYHNSVWPGDSVYPDYFDRETSRKISDMTVKFIQDTGVTGIWCDMNEPASFNGPLPDDVMFGNYSHDRVHNVYGDHMVRAVAKAFNDLNMRPYVITRACFATSSPYTTVWNGDNQSLWAHLRASLPQVSTMNLCGFPLDGVDVGGFGNECTKELIIRWIQANIFSPFLRNHSSLNTRDQEPYAFDGETLSVYKKFLRLRYDIVPYLYDLAYRAHLYGDPIIRPMFYQYPDDPNCYRISDQIMIGDSLMLAPILDPGAEHRSVYLPKGKWIQWFGDRNKIVSGGKIVAVDVPLDSTALYLRADSIIPMYNGLNTLSRKPDELTVLLGGKPAKYTVYDDDGKSADGRYNTYELTFNGKVLKVLATRREYESTYKTLRVISGDKEIVVPFGHALSIDIN